MSMRAALAAILLLATSSCTLSSYESGKVACDDDVPCPSGFACLDPRRSGTATCIAVGCNDGIVAVGEEDCDDANDNDLDLCVGCRRFGYAARSAHMIGFGPGGSSVDTTPVGRPTVLASNDDGTLFVGSVGTNVITRRTPDGTTLTAFAGNGSLVSRGNGEATPPNEITTVFVSSLAADGLGNLYAADLQNAVIRRIDGVTGDATIVAGTGVQGRGDDTLGVLSELDIVTGVVADGDGNVFVGEKGTGGDGVHRVRRLDRDSGVLTTVIAHPGIVDLDNPPPADEALSGPPDDIAITGDGRLILFTNAADFPGDEIEPSTFLVPINMTITSLTVNDVGGVVAGRRWNLPVQLDRVVLDPVTRNVTERTIVETYACLRPGTTQERIAVAPDGKRVWMGAGSLLMQVDLGDDGAVSCTPIAAARSDDSEPEAPAATPRLSLTPADIALSNGTLYWADPGNGVVWQLDPEQSVDLANAAVDVVVPELVDIAAGQAREEDDDDVDNFFGLIEDLILEFAKQTDGHLVVGFTDACRKDDQPPLGEGAPAFNQLEFFGSFPQLHRVLLSDCGSAIAVVGGDGIAGFAGDGGPAVKARFDEPSAMVRGPDNHLYVADTNNNRIRRLLVIDDGIESTRDDQTADVETFIGPGGSAPGAARSLRLDHPTGLAVDDLGRLLIADRTNQIVAVDVVTGTVTPILGTGVAGDALVTNDPLATQIDEPAALVFIPFFVIPDSPFGDSGGALFVVERGGHRVRAVVTLAPAGTRSSIVFELAGDGTPGSLDNDDGLAAQLLHPRAMMLSSPSADLSSIGFYVVDGIDRIRIVDVRIDGLSLSAGVRTSSIVIDGTGALARDDGSRDDALLRSPVAMTFLDDDHVIVVDRVTGRLRRLRLDTSDADALEATVETITGMPGAPAVGGDDVPVAVAAPLASPGGIALWPAHADVPATLWVSEGEARRLRRFTLPDIDDPTTWTTNAVALDHAFSEPAGLAVDVDSGTLFVADAGNHTIVAVDLDRVLDGDAGAASRFAGVPFRRGISAEKTPPLEATFNEPRGVAVASASGERVVLVADTGNNRVRRIGRDGVITVLGTGDAAAGGEGAPASRLPVLRPRGLAVDGRGNVFVSATNGVRFLQSGGDRLVDADDDVRTIYGSARSSFPANATRCLTDVALAPVEGPLGHDAWVLDSCLGTLQLLRRGPVVDDAVGGVPVD